MRSPWFILTIVLSASMAAPLNQFKVPPVMPLLMEAFGQSAARAGLLMSLFAISGLILALPAGFIFQRLGHQLTGMIAILSLIVGSTLGAFSTGLDTMLLSRFIEGAGMSFMSVVAPAIIALWFSADQRGRAMGIWAVWVPLGSTIMFLLAPLLVEHWAWQGVWWFGFFYTVVVGLLFYLFIGSGPRLSSEQNPPDSTNASMGRGLRGVLRNRDLWLISLLFGCFNFVYIAFMTWTPTFLHQIRGASVARASFLVSITSILTMVACPIAGWISDKLGSRKIICVTPMILMAFLFPLNFSAGENLFLALAIGLGFIGGFVLIILLMTFIFWCLKIALHARDLSGTVIAFGIVSLFSWQIFINVGMVLGVLPVVGIPLPFLSYGGSAMVSFMAAIGLLMNINARRFILQH